MTFETVIILDKRPWLPKQVDQLKFRINTMMELNGTVNFAEVAYYCHHTIAACESKAFNLGLQFSKKSPVKTIPYHDRPSKGDMRTLPKHTQGDLKGRNVDYNRSWKL